MQCSAWRQNTRNSAQVRSDRNISLCSLVATTLELKWHKFSRCLEMQQVPKVCSRAHTHHEEHAHRELLERLCIAAHWKMWMQAADGAWLGHVTFGLPGGPRAVVRDGSEGGVSWARERVGNLFHGFHRCRMHISVTSPGARHVSARGSGKSDGHGCDVIADGLCGSMQWKG